MFVTRHAHSKDFHKIYSLYKKVAQEKIGIARSAEEISEIYVTDFMKRAADTGIELVIAHPEDPSRLIGEIHCYSPTPFVFRHVLSELTIVVDQEFHGKGLGKLIFNDLLEFITQNRPDIARVELVAQESNTRAIELYKKIGFREEGRFEKRIRINENDFEADIPMAWFNSNYHHAANK